MTDSTSRQQNSDGEKNRRSKTQVAPHKNIFLRFLSYYTGQRHLFFMDMVCALVIAGTELAFPQILRQLAGGLFTEGKDAIVGSLALVAVGLIGMYALHFFCRVFVIS